jgi:hypothetical protein
VGQAVSDPKTIERNREIARNESARQAVGAIRVSTWAVAVAIVVGLAAVGWVLIHNK